MAAIKRIVVYISLLGFVVGNKLRNVYHFVYNEYVKKQLGFVGDKVHILPKATIVGGDCINIGNGSFVGRGGVITAWKSYRCKVFTPSISIGSDVSLGEFNHITAINSISIGDGVLTGRWVTISDNAHGNLDDDTALMPSERDLYSKGSVTIEDNVWIGDKVTILPNVRIGEGSVIGANSVVTKDIPPFCVAAGNPAKIIRKLNEHKSR